MRQYGVGERSSRQVDVQSRAQVGHVDLGAISLQKAAEAMAVDEIT